MKKGDFDPTEFVDHYEEALVEMLRQRDHQGSLLELSRSAL
jgi:non-homologous end joining protein Ku